MTLYWQPEERTSVEAEVDRGIAAQLAGFDHHRVVVGDRWGILITYHWLPLAEAPDPLVARVIFQPAPDYLLNEAEVRFHVQRHPPAPPFIQDLVDRLPFA